MDVTPTDVTISPALRNTLERVAGGTAAVRIVSAHGDYRLVAQGMTSAGDRRPSGPAHLGTMEHLGRDLADLD